MHLLLRSRNALLKKKARWCLLSQAQTAITIRHSKRKITTDTQPSNDKLIEQTEEEAWQKALLNNSYFANTAKTYKNPKEAQLTTAKPDKEWNTESSAHLLGYFLRHGEFPKGTLKENEFAAIFRILWYRHNNYDLALHIFEKHLPMHLGFSPDKVMNVFVKTISHLTMPLLDKAMNNTSTLFGIHPDFSQMYKGILGIYKLATQFLSVDTISLSARDGLCLKYLKMMRVVTAAASLAADFDTATKATKEFSQFLGPLSLDEFTRTSNPDDMQLFRLEMYLEMNYIAAGISRFAYRKESARTEVLKIQASTIEKRMAEVEEFALNLANLNLPNTPSALSRDTKIMKYTNLQPYSSRSLAIHLLKRIANYQAVNRLNIFRATQYVEMMSAIDPEQEAEGVRVLVDGYSRIDGTSNVVDQLVNEHGLYSTASLTRSMIMSLLKSGQKSKAIDMIVNWRQINAQQAEDSYDLLLNDFLVKNDLTGAEKFIDTLHSQRMEVSPKMYSALLKYYAKNGLLERILKLATTLEKEGKIYADLLKTRDLLNMEKV